MELHDPKERESHQSVTPGLGKPLRRKIGNGFHEADKEQDARQKVISGVDDMVAFMKDPWGGSDPKENPGEGKSGDASIDVPS
jgi:hypothetical protein